MKKGLIRLIALIVITCACAFGFAACGGVSLDLSEYLVVTYDCMGGNIDSLPSRVLYGKPGSIVIEPKGSIGLVQAKRKNFTLIGWYTAHGEGSYTPSEEGDFVDYYEYTESTTGDFVGEPYYYEDANGGYVHREVEGSWIYDIYDAENAEHKGLTRYSLITVYSEYDEENPEHKSLTRYSREQSYVLYNENNPNHEGLIRYFADFTWDENDRWDFATDRLEDKDITLYARWEYNLKIFWDYQNDRGEVYPYENGLLGIEINRGEPIPQKDVVPTKAGQTFTYWYKDKECTEKWDFSSDVFPTDETVTAITLYAGYVDGQYTRVTKLKDFKDAISKDTSSKLLLLSDIDFSGEEQNFSNGKLTIVGEKQTARGTTFKGEINGLGNTIKGIKIVAVGTETPKEGNVINRYFGFFGQTENAVIKNVNLEGEIVFDTSSINNIYIGASVGRDKGGSVIENVTTNFTLTATDENPAICDVVVGGGVAAKTPTTVIQGCVFTDGNILKEGINTSGTVTVVS